jgi:hypothetical protein
MRGRPPPKRAPDYTGAALAMGLVNLLWIFVALWAAFGFWAVLAAGLGLNHAITRLAQRRPRS